MQESQHGFKSGLHYVLIVCGADRVLNIYMNDSPSISPDTIIRRGDDDFEANIDRLINEAEEMRLSFMKRQRTRGYITTSCGLISIVAGAAGFGWFLLVKGNILSAVACMLIALCIPAILYTWSAAIIKDYKRAYKDAFLPKMAKALGGFQFHPARGIGRKLISKTGLIPAHEVYHAEDCFMGKYNGVKVLFSEARLRFKKAYIEPIFDGIFVLLETPSDVLEGHTILTLDDAMYRKWAPTRWKQLSDVKIDTDVEAFKDFRLLSDQPEAAKLLAGEKLLKELHEASVVFDNAKLSVAFFRKKYIFLMIPYKGDMFEASNMHVPVATKQHARQCKKEIEQLLEIIDVFDLYKMTSAQPAKTPSETPPKNPPADTPSAD